MPDKRTPQYNLSSALAQLCWRASDCHWNTIVLYGAGKHTQRFLDSLKMLRNCPLRVTGIVDDHHAGEQIDGLTIVAPSEIRSIKADALVISSDTFEETMLQKALQLNPPMPVYALYKEDKPSSDPARNQLVEDIINLPSDWHKAGTMMGPVLKAMIRHSEGRPIRRSLETGSGKTTLLLSNISEKHTVFSLDGGTDSITAVRKSPLFRSDRVEWIEGPSQLTLPQYKFTDVFDFALIDGPHGYPFPELEYYYIYPHLAEGALLLVDDIHIPTITNLFNFLKEEVMFELLEVVLTTAFFRRTCAPLFSPTGDGWWLQAYNRKHFPVDEHPSLRELLTKPL